MVFLLKIKNLTFSIIMFIPLRRKILFFSVILVLLPMSFSGISMILIVQDEIKSAINDNLLNTAENLVKELEYGFSHAWVPPLDMIQTAVDNEDLGIQEKVALLKSAIQRIEGFLSLQLIVEDFPPAQFMKPELSAALQHSASNSLEALALTPPTPLTELMPTRAYQLRGTSFWVLPIWVPLRPINGKAAYLLVHADLRQIQSLIKNHPFSRTGRIFLLNQGGEVLFSSQPNLAPAPELLSMVADLMRHHQRAVSVLPYQDHTQQARLGSYAMLNNPPWVVLATVDKAKIYNAISRMRWQLLGWVLAGLGLAAGVALMFARRISRPILEVSSVARQVGQGNFNVRVGPLCGHDEISMLGGQINTMIQGLQEHFHLQKFVSGDTLRAVRQAGADGVKLGGERRAATVLFSDIRGFTAFSEKVPPETVIQMLNTYLRAQAKIVKKYHGDIDKYVGDELVAVFQGEAMADNAIGCASEIHRQVEKLNQEAEEWNIACGIGINSGEMVMGAMGSEERMDYTILGDNVNLGARLCANAPPHTTLISDRTLAYIQKPQQFIITPLEPIQVKGKALPVTIFSVIQKAIVE